MIGTSFGRYYIEEELGSGGMSVVYRGTDSSLEREVAIKVLHAHLAKKRENRLRLHREAKAIARLKHPNILEIYDYGSQDDDNAYIVMEYVRGMTLKQFLSKHGPCPDEFGACIALELTQALGQAHAHGIIHRDLKPENVMVSGAGHLKLMDFGIAHVFDAETMTQTGSLLGSPAHMAPEMIEGELVDERADIFALGTVLYWSVTGQLPFEGKSPAQILRRVLEGIYKNPEAADPRVSKGLGDIIRRCMAHDVSQRYQNIQEVEAALTKYLEGAAIESPSNTLQAYFLSPAESQATFEETLLPALVKRGACAMRQGNPAQAFNHFNRVLGYDPQNVEVNEHLRRLERRHRPLWIAAGALVVTIGAVGAWSWHQQTQLNAHTQHMQRTQALTQEATQRARVMAYGMESLMLAHTVVEQASVGARARSRETLDQNARAQADAMDTGDDRVTHARLIAGDLSAKMRQAIAAARITTKAPDLGTSVSIVPPVLLTVSPPKPVPTTWDYRFKVLPPTATLTIAGEQRTAIEAMNQGVALEPGLHTIRVGAPGCAQHTQRIRVSGPQDETSRSPIVLTWRPGTVKITSDVQSTVFIDGKPLGTLRPNQVRSFQFPFGKANARPPARALNVVLYASSDMTRQITKRVRLRPGATQNVQGSFLRR